MKRLFRLLVAIIFVSVTGASVFAVEDDDFLLYLPASLSPGMSLNSDLVFEPATIFVNESTVVTFGVVAKNVRQGKTIDVYECDADGKVLQKVLSLYDDGDLAKGDDIAGDGIFHNKMTISKSILQSSYFVAKIGNLSTTTSRMIVANHFTAQDLTNVTQVQNQANSIYTQATNAGSSGAAAIQQVQDYLNQQSSVLVTDKSVDGEGLWWVDSSKILCLYGPKLEDAALQGGGRIDPIPPELRNQKILLPRQLSPGKAAPYQPSRMKFLLNAAAADNEYAESNSAICIAPYKYQFEPWDAADDIAKLLKDNGFNVDEIYSASADTGTIEGFKFLSKYGAILINTHGSIFYNGIFSWWKDKYGEQIPWYADGSSQVCILTNVKVTDVNRNTYEQDLTSQRLAIVQTSSGQWYCILPAFIHFYSSNFPKSLVFLTACYSTNNNSMANAFLTKGAKTYFGYSNSVKTDFNFNHTMAVFNEMIKNGKNTGQVPGVGDVGDGPYFAVFERIGATNLAFDLGLKNSDFETGNLNGWMGSGDTQIITSLGPLKPKSGNYMAMISTGLGSVNDSISSLEQKFRVPDAANTITFIYNVVSEEPMEYVGSEFDDRAVVEFTTDTGSTVTLAAESINASTWYPISGINFYGGDDTTFQTGWKTVTADIAAYRGKFVILKIRCWDNGDSIYDTAMVIDAIKIN